MKLRDLGGQFLKLEVEVEVRTWTRANPDGSFEEVTGPAEIHRYVDSLAEADGVMFLCPKCFAENAGPVGTHSVLCWFVGKVPDETDPKPGRWNPSGTGLDDLTFVPPGATSVKLLGGCQWHGFVRHGNTT